MTVEISASHPVDPSLKDRLKRTAEMILEALAEEEKTVGIHLVNDSEIRKLNRRFRHRDKSTNVLSFPADFGSIPPTPLSKGGAIPSAPLSKGGPRGDEIGEIVISLETAAREAAPDEDLESRLTCLIAHGMLHLIGFDHHGKGHVAWDQAEKKLESILRNRTREIPKKGLALDRNEP
jgi:probable rRNA maturation factor